MAPDGQRGENEAETEIEEDNDLSILDSLPSCSHDHGDEHGKQEDCVGLKGAEDCLGKVDIGQKGRYPLQVDADSNTETVEVETALYCTLLKGCHRRFNSVLITNYMRVMSERRCSDVGWR